MRIDVGLQVDQLFLVMIISYSYEIIAILVEGFVCKWYNGWKGSKFP